MDYELRVVVEKVAVASQEVVQRNTLKIYDVKPPRSTLELGLRHAEQISLLEKIQNSLLAEQSKLIEPTQKTCPKCGQKLSRNGYKQSKFHAVFSDHNLRLQKHRCKAAGCGWQSAPTVLSKFGTNIHPELAKLQCEQGALYSYREAQSNLDNLNTYHRSVNSHTQIARLTNRVGELISHKHLIPSVDESPVPPAKELLVQVDAGRLPIKEKGSSIEALSAMVYRVENSQRMKKRDWEKTSRSCVLAAHEDELSSIKALILNAARKQGMTKKSLVTVIADGTQNCWSAIASLTPHCQKLTPILDWLQIAIKFQTLRPALGEKFEEFLDSCKWDFWEGRAHKGLAKLEMLSVDVCQSNKQSEIKRLYDYLYRNQTYIANYSERQELALLYTSPEPGSCIEAIIKARHKKTGKMQWSKVGAHNILQIRAEMIGNEWSKTWQKFVLPALKAEVS